MKIHFAKLSYSKIMSRALKNYGIEKWQGCKKNITEY